MGDYSIIHSLREDGLAVKINEFCILCLSSSQFVIETPTYGEQKAVVCLVPFGYYNIILIDSGDHFVTFKGH